MTVFQAIFLAVMQGLTEFLPVSSSGHLVLFQKIFQLSKPPVVFDVFLHLGTLVAVLVYFRKEIFCLLKEWRRNINVWVLLIIATIPAIIFGLCINNVIEEIFNSIKLVGGMWLIMGTMLLLTKKINKENSKEEFNNIEKKDALIIGFFQAMALMPGISRSGFTIFGGLLRKLSPKTAFVFSFLLAVPAILGAAGLKFIDGGLGSINPAVGVISIIITGAIGYCCLILLQNFLKQGKLYIFGYYCLFLALIVFIL